jgi:hypothetical protein
MHLQIHTVLMDNHDINLPFADIPLHRNPEGKSLEARLAKRHAVYDGLKRSFGALLASPEELEITLRAAVAARGGGTRISVSVDPIPQPPERRAGRLAAGVMQRAILVDLATLTIASVLGRFPRDLLGRRPVRRLEVRVGPVHHEVVLSVRWVAVDDGEGGDLSALASTATRGGGALDHVDHRTINIRFPIP